MNTNIVVDDGVIYLQCLNEGHVSDRYLSWMKDLDVNKFLEVRHSPPKSISDLEIFIDSVRKDPAAIIFGIFMSNGDHIGNIKLSSINWLHEHGEIGIQIGEKSCWGKGYATRAIRLLCSYAFRELKLKKLVAGCYEENIGSRNAFIKSGFKIEGRLFGYWKLGNVRSSEIIMGICQDEFCLNE